MAQPRSARRRTRRRSPSGFGCRASMTATTRRVSRSPAGAFSFRRIAATRRTSIPAPAAVLARWPEGMALSARDAGAQIAIVSHARGAAIDAAGRLWVARSNLRWGELDRLDPATGKVEREYKAPPGIEGIAFAADGRLWAVSEAGARHYYDGNWRAWVLPFYPLIVAIDPDRL